MTKPAPPIQKYMTTTPVTVTADQTIAQAYRIMRDKNIRHLPVLAGDRLVGVITERDVALIHGLKEVDADTVVVADAMTERPYTASPDAPLSQVALEMAEKKHGVAIVTDNDSVVGVFTMVDACRLLSEVFDARAK